MPDSTMLQSKDLQERYERYKAKIKNFTIMNDIFMRNVLKKKECTEYILQVIMEDKGITVIDQTLQKDYKNLQGRSAILDCVAKDASNRQFNVEIQGDNEEASPKRARYHCGLLDMNILNPRESFDALPDTYVIFITEHDKYGAGLPLYHVERTVTELQHTTFGDGAHIIYVNGAFRDLEHPVGRLMHDMNCTDPNKMLNPLLAKEVRYLKETEGGRSQMCRAFEEVARESARDAEYQKAVRTAKKMLALGQLNLETIAECTELSLDEVKALADKKPA